MEKLLDLDKAYDGSYYTIIGAGGPLDEWEAGYNKLLEGQGIGTPTKWFQTTGKDINEYVESTGDNNHDPLADEVTVILFPLDGLDVGVLAIFKLQMGDRWFDYIVDNMR